MKGKLETVLAVVVILSLGLAACGPRRPPPRGRGKSGQRDRGGRERGDNDGYAHPIHADTVTAD